MKIPKMFSQKEIAFKMFPNNKNADAHLSRKLNNKNGQSINDADKIAIAEIIMNETKAFCKDILK